MLSRLCSNFFKAKIKSSLIKNNSLELPEGKDKQLVHLDDIFTLSKNFRSMDVT